MSTKIDALQLQSTVSGILDRYGQSAENVLAEAVWRTAGDVVKELKRGGSFNGTGAYNRDWSRKLDRKRLYASATVYNKTHYQLTHLLEFGHAKQNGGRTRAFPHIGPANDQVEALFVDNFTDLMAEVLID